MQDRCYIIFATAGTTLTGLSDARCRILGPP